MKKSILKNLKEVEDWFSQTDSHIFAVDTELKDISQLNMQIAGISFCDGERACYIDLLDNREIDEIESTNLLQEIIKSSTIILHSAPFDLRVLHNYRLGVPRDIFCTMTAAHLINENQRKGLKFLAAKYLGATDIVTFEDASADGFHTEKFYRYALNDVVWTWQLYEIFKPELKKQKLWDLWYNIERPFQYCLRDLAINGIAVDREELIKLQEKMIGVVTDLRLKMYEAGGITHTLKVKKDGSEESIPSVNINSHQQLADLIRFELGIELTEKTPSGGYSTKGIVLESVKHKHKFIELLLEYRSASKLLNSFLIPLPTLIEADGRIRVDFHNTVAVTGRVSASRLHQLPKENTGPVPVRQCFIPEEGKVLICADYAGQELRVLGHVSKDPTMIDAFKNKIDVHFMIANIFFELGIPPEALVETHKDYKKYRKKFKNERDKIKTVNFGIAYGKTAYGFAKDWNIPVPEAEKFIDEYFKRFPNIKKAISKCTFLVKQQKAIRNLTGRIRRFSGYISYRQFRQAFNFLVQGPSADMMKKAAGDFRKVCLEHPEWGCLFVLTLHDELVYEALKEYAEEIRVALKGAMENAIELCMPLVADVGVGLNYSEAKL